MLGKEQKGTNFLSSTAYILTRNGRHGSMVLSLGPQGFITGWIGYRSIVFLYLAVGAMLLLVVSSMTNHPSL